MFVFQNGSVVELRACDQIYRKKTVTEAELKDIHAYNKVFSLTMRKLVPKQSQQMTWAI